MAVVPLSLRVASGASTSTSLDLPRHLAARAAARSRRTLRARARADAGAGTEDVLAHIVRTIRSAKAAGRDPDFFELLGVQVGTDPEDIKKSYRERARVCHPDVAGSEGHEACVVLNEAYATLMDDELREAYQVERTFGSLGFQGSGDALRDLYDILGDTDIGRALRRTPYTGEPLSKVVGRDHFACKIETDEQAAKACFVDELSCVGCERCFRSNPAVFRMEGTGRARVFGQWLTDEESIQIAIDTCPVDCIHWVPKEQLAPLEYVMQHVLRDRAVFGKSPGDVFAKTAKFIAAIQKATETENNL